MRRAEADMLKARGRFKEIETWSKRPELLQARRSLEMSRQKLDRTTVYAPMAGVVMRPKSGKDGKTVDMPEVGAQVQSGQALFSLGADQPLGGEDAGG